MTKNEKIAIALIKKAMELRRLGILCLLALALTACGAGYQATASLGYHRIDEIQSSQKTYKQPLICLFKHCDQPTEAQGS